MTYDITDKKRLKRVAKLLLRYGHRVQKSVFVCDINERRLRELEAKLQSEKQPGDSITVYEYNTESAEEIEPAAGKNSEQNGGTGRNRHGIRPQTGGRVRLVHKKTEKNGKKTGKKEPGPLKYRVTRNKPCNQQLQRKGGRVCSV